MKSVNLIEQKLKWPMWWAFLSRCRNMLWQHHTIWTGKYSDSAVCIVIPLTLGTLLKLCYDSTHVNTSLELNNVNITSVYLLMTVMTKGNNVVDMGITTILIVDDMMPLGRKSTATGLTNIHVADLAKPLNLGM